jgi:hypothetical protein
MLLTSYLGNVHVTTNGKMQFSSWITMPDAPTTESYSPNNLMFGIAEAVTYRHHYLFKAQVQTMSMLNRGHNLKVSHHWPCFCWLIITFYRTSRYVYN